MDAGLNVRVSHVAAEFLCDLEDRIHVFLLGMENKNPNRDQQGIDGESDHSRRSPKSRSETGGKDHPAFAAVEKNSESSG